MNKVFLYDNKLDLGIGNFASVVGYECMSFKDRDGVEAVPATGQYERIYGYVYDVDDDVLDMLDVYYGVGIGMHRQVNVLATLEGGASINAIMYEFQYAEIF